MYNSSELSLASLRALLLFTILVTPPHAEAKSQLMTLKQNVNVEQLPRRVPFKKDVFMSRGWGAGGTSYSTQPKLEFAKKIKVLDIIGDYEDRPEIDDGPVHQFLRSPKYVEPKPLATYRRYPQLFISSGWGPLGK